jgi:hypothetical protein
VKGTLYKVAFHKTVTQLGIAMAAFIVDGENAIVYFEHSDIQVEGGHCNTCTLKQIGLSRYVNPVAHDQMVSKKGNLQTQEVNFSFRPWTKMSFLRIISQYKISSHFL